MVPVRHCPPWIRSCRSTGTRSAGPGTDWSGVHTPVRATKGARPLPDGPPRPPTTGRRSLGRSWPGHLRSSCAAGRHTPARRPGRPAQGHMHNGVQDKPTNVERPSPTRSSTAPPWMQSEGTATSPAVVPVPSVPEREAGPCLPEVIALATDLTDASEPATQHAIELAARLGARLIVVNVLERRRTAAPGRLLESSGSALSASRPSGPSYGGHSTVASGPNPWCGRATWDPASWR